PGWLGRGSFFVIYASSKAKADRNFGAEQTEAVVPAAGRAGAEPRRAEKAALHERRHVQVVNLPDQTCLVLEVWNNHAMTEGQVGKHGAVAARVAGQQRCLSLAADQPRDAHVAVHVDSQVSKRPRQFDQQSRAGAVEMVRIQQGGVVSIAG